MIAATNLPNVLDPALRRPGRFDREIAIPIPDRNGRLEVLEIHSRGMPLMPDVQLGRLADVTHGFVGADLEALCKEAAMLCLRRLMSELDLGLSSIPYEQLDRLVVSMDDFLSALAEIDPSAIREVFVEIPDVRWEDVGGLADTKARLVEALEWPLRYPQLLAQAGAKPSKGILLVGPTGCGKTWLAKAAANECGVNFIPVKGPELMSKYIGESEKAVRDVFRKARHAAPCLLFFDEVDALAPRRGEDASGAHVSERLLSQFLTEFDGIEDLKGVMVLAATNRIDMLDTAVLRPGRFDEIIEIPSPNAAARSEIFNIHLRHKPLANDVVGEQLAAQSDGFSAAEIASVCRRAALSAVRRAVEAGAHDPALLQLTAGDLAEAIQEATRRHRQAP